MILKNEFDCFLEKLQQHSRTAHSQILHYLGRLPPIKQENTPHLAFSISRTCFRRRCSIDDKMEKESTAVVAAFDKETRSNAALLEKAQEQMKAIMEQATANKVTAEDIE